MNGTNTLNEPPRARRDDVCPWWLGWLLASPLRRLVDENPERLLGPFLRPGLRVLDFGAAMGFFTLPAARLVGESGCVTAMDLQPKMLAGLRRRAAGAGLASRVETIECGPADLGALPADARFDVVLLIYVLHEVPDATHTLRQLAGLLAPQGRLLLVEPAGHVPADAFARELEAAGAAGLVVDQVVAAGRGHGRLLRRKDGNGG
jgi:2-polyprenyl-3-methyl-5-hydroxy-6-metoxy-1,4-benzoquinol methylase